MVFSIPTSFSLGDRPKRVVDERAKGVNFAVSRPKKGKGNDAYLDGGAIINAYLWSGERATDAETQRRREMMESAKRNLTPAGFAYASPAQKGEGLGSYYGCFQSSPWPHVPSQPQTHVAKAHRAQPEGEGGSGPARGIYTSPAKKGTGYGYPGLTLSEVGCDYIATYYDAPQRLAREERARWAAKMPAEPFKPCGRRGFTFDESPITGVSKCYVMTVPFREKKPEKPMTHFIVAAPWRPAGYVDDGPVPVEYWEDPYGGYDPRVDPKALVKKPSEDVFVPSSRTDTFWYTQSIVFKRI